MLGAPAFAGAPAKAGTVLNLANTRTRRGGVGLTPMVDVVFLLLVFFMLAATYGDEARALRLGMPAADDGGDKPPADPATTSGPPRLVSVLPDRVRVNGFVTPIEGLAEAVRPLMPTPDAVIILRPVEGASLQRVVDVIDALKAGGIHQVVLTEE
ncbi:MAG: biopolymer transporter ExbD [Pseudomonadota bacterium]